MFIILRPICLLLCSLLVVSCSLFSITYNYADTFIRWQLDDYFNLTKEQEKWLTPRLAKLVAWHRQEEMPQYVAVLKTVKQQGEDGYTLEEFETTAEAFNQAYMRLTNYVLDDAVDFLLQLSPEQIDYLEQQLVKKNQERIKKRGNSAQERRAYGKKQFIKNLEKWTGKLTPSQVDEFTQIYLLNAANQEGSPESWDTRRKASQQAWLTMLRSQPDRTTLRAWLENFFANGSSMPQATENLSDTSQITIMSSTREERMEQNLANGLIIDNALNTQQRQKALKNLQKWINRMAGVL